MIKLLYEFENNVDVTSTLDVLNANITLELKIRECLKNADDKLKEELSLLLFYLECNKDILKTFPNDVKSVFSTAYDILQKCIELLN